MGARGQLRLPCQPFPWQPVEERAQIRARQGAHFQQAPQEDGPGKGAHDSERGRAHHQRDPRLLSERRLPVGRVLWHERDDRAARHRHALVE